MNNKRKPIVARLPTSTSLTNKLKKLGYDVTIFTERGVLLKNGRPVFGIHYRKTQLPHCCGVEELGNLSMHSTYPAIPVEVRNLFIQRVFLAAKGRAIKQRRPVVFCSNGESHCSMAEAALENFPHYQLVSTTVNPYSGRTIKMYVTTS